MPDEPTPEDRTFTEPSTSSEPEPVTASSSATTPSTVPPPPSLSEVGKRLKMDSREGLTQLLSSLQEESEDIRIQAESVLELFAEVAVARLAGVNTQVAETALKAATLNLAAASSVSIGNSVIKFASDVLEAATVAAISSLRAVLDE